MTPGGSRSRVVAVALVLAAPALAPGGGEGSQGADRDEAVRLLPVSTVSAAVVGVIKLTERWVEFVDGERVALEPLPSDAGGDERLFRIVGPEPLAPLAPNTVCGPGDPVTHIAVARPSAGEPTRRGVLQPSYRIAFYTGEEPPVIAGVREGPAGEGLCLWGSWEETRRPPP